MVFRNLKFLFLGISLLAHAGEGDYQVADMQIMSLQAKVFKSCQNRCLDQLEDKLKEIAKNERVPKSALARHQLEALAKIKSLDPLDPSKLETLIREISSNTLTLSDSNSLGANISRMIYYFVTYTVLNKKGSIDKNWYYVAGRALFHYDGEGLDELQTFVSLEASGSTRSKEANEMIGLIRALEKTSNL